MEPRHIALKLFLDTLEVDLDIETLDDRKAVQKAVYLGQRAGVDLSYRFGWYRMGPYSPALTRDYFPLASAIEAGDRSYGGKRLRKRLAERLQRIVPMLQPPTASITKENWLELLASVDYLIIVRKMSRPEARDVIAQEKPHLVDWFDIGVDRLIAFGFIGEPSDEAI